MRGTLYLNASCALIRNLAEQGGNAEGRDAALLMLYQMARLFCGRMLTAADVTAAFRDFTRSVEGLLKPRGPHNP